MSYALHLIAYVGGAGWLTFFVLSGIMQVRKRNKRNREVEAIRAVMTKLASVKAAQSEDGAAVFYIDPSVTGKMGTD